MTQEAKRFMSYVVCRAFRHKPEFVEELVIVPISYGEHVSKIQLRARVKKFLIDKRDYNEVDVLHVSPASATSYQTITYEGELRG